MCVCSSLALVNLSIFWLKIFDSSIPNSPTCGLINFTMDSSTLWAKKLVPLWILISSCDESCPFVDFYPYNTSLFTYEFNHGSVYLWTKLWTRPLVNPSTLILGHKSFWWNEFVLFMDFISLSTLMMGLSTCDPGNIKVSVLKWTRWWTLPILCIQK